MNRVGAIVFFLLVFIFSCQYKPTHQKQIFRYNELAGITSLDPAFASNLSNIWASQQIFNTLFQLDDHLQIQPMLAHSWQMNDSNTRFVCTLRQDVFFHPNPCFKEARKLIANDVAFSFNRLLHTGNGSWITDYIKKNDDTLHILCPDDSTVVFTLQRSFVPFIQLLAVPITGIVPHEAVAFYGKDFARNPVGTGPFLFKRWVDNEKLVLSKNPHYFERDSLGTALPYLDGIAISFVKDPQTALLGFLTGAFDMLSGMEKPYRETLINDQGQLKSKYAHDFRFHRMPFLNVEYIGFHPDANPQHPLRHPSLRKALHLLLDKQMITRYVRRDVGIPALQGFVPPALQSQPWQSDYEQTNRSAALQLLHDAGFSHPSEVPSFTLFCDPLYADIYTQVVNQWKREGFVVNLEVLDRPTLKSQIAKGRLLCFRASWIADFADANSYLSLFYSPNFSPNGPNYTHFSNTQADLLFESSMAEPHDSIRNLMYQMMHALIEDESPVIPLYYDEVVRFTHRRVIGMKINVMNHLLLKQIHIQP
ncbi:MAG: ABC transporter substrate-binding protein [Candidatus Competibacteraceae bacterium]|nr:ABC transporter substrate-binding protein [Candidatus Competibacteraceae bacterium]